MSQKKGISLDPHSPVGVQNYTATPSMIAPHPLPLAFHVF